MDYNGTSLVKYVINECKKTGLPVVVAIPYGDHDLFDHLIGDVSVFYGSENDVMERYYNCAKVNGFDTIIRVCADSKVLHHELITQELENFKKYGHLTYGNFCTVFSFDQLEQYYYNDKRPDSREHVISGMLKDMTVDYGVDLIDN